jgi:fructose-1,6-bisphosphatase/inositol monophosphatase family enzyme
MNGRPAGASAREDVQDSVLAPVAWSTGRRGRSTAWLGPGVPVRTWGNAYGLALAATGRVDAFFDAGVHPWDVAPAPVLMADAGGCFAPSTARDRSMPTPPCCAAHPCLSPSSPCSEAESSEAARRATGRTIMAP